MFWSAADSARESIKSPANALRACGAFTLLDASKQRPKRSSSLSRLLRADANFHEAILRTASVRRVRRDRIRGTETLRRVVLRTQTVVLQILHHRFRTALRQLPVMQSGTG